MIELGGKRLCENCFSEVEGQLCPKFGYNAQASGCYPMILKPGSILRGKFIVGKCLDKGGFGITYLAYDTKLEKTVAIKEFSRSGRRSEPEETPPFPFPQRQTRQHSKPARRSSTTKQSWYPVLTATRTSWRFMSSSMRTTRCISRWNI